MALRRIAFPLVACLVATAAAAAPRLDDFKLDLGGVRFDPATQTPAGLLPDAWRADPGRLAGGEAFLLAQLPGRSHPADLERLRAAGLEVVQYVHPFTYIVWG